MVTQPAVYQVPKALIRTAMPPARKPAPVAALASATAAAPKRDSAPAPPANESVKRIKTVAGAQAKVTRPRIRQDFDHTSFIPAFIDTCNALLLSRRSDGPAVFAPTSELPALPLAFDTPAAYAQTFHRFVLHETVAGLCESSLRLVPWQVRVHAIKDKPVRAVIDVRVPWPVHGADNSTNKSLAGFREAQRLAWRNAHRHLAPEREFDASEFALGDVVVLSPTALSRDAVGDAPFMLRESEDRDAVVWRGASPIVFAVVVGGPKMCFQQETASFELALDDAGLTDAVGTRAYEVAWPQCFTYYVNSIVSARREFDGVTAVQRSLMMPHIMQRAAAAGKAGVLTDDDVAKPVASPRKLSLKGVTDVYREAFAERFNESQLEAIASAVELKEGFCLVQGPPGTGKTTTMLGLLNTLHLNVVQECYEQGLPDIASTTLAALPEDDFLSDRGNPHLLVVAPSNKAIDHVLGQIRDKGFMDGTGRRYNPECTRLGSERWTRDDQTLSEFSAEAKVTEMMNLHNDDLVKLASELAARLKGLTKEVERLKRIASEAALAHALNPSAETFNRFHEDASQLVDTRNRAKECAVSAERCNLLHNRSLSTHELRVRLKTLVLMRSHLIFTTLSQCGSRAMTEIAPRNIVFRVVVVDEAAQAVEPSVVIPLSLGCERCVLVGDPMQLSATVKSPRAKAALYETSLFERLQRAGHPAHMLQVQYRCRPEISGFVSASFYNNALANGANVMKPEYRLSMHDRRQPDGKYAYGPLVFWNVPWGETTVEKQSYVNKHEAEVCLRAFQVIRDRWQVASPISHKPVSVAIITPYREQVLYMRGLFRSAGVDLVAPDCGLQIDSVDAFQGNEVDVVVFSCVRAEETEGIGCASHTTTARRRK